MSDITFVTHLRYDSEDRINNFQTVLNYYSNNIPGSKFIVIEDDVKHNPSFDKIKWPKGTSFYFSKNEGWYHRTRALNYGIKKANTSIVVSFDTDCIVPIQSVNYCRSELLKDATIAWPYNGYFIDISYKRHNDFIQNFYNYNTLLHKLGTNLSPALQEILDGGNMSVRCTNTTHKSVGGIVMFNKERFLEIGGYNEKFIAWGAEDNELDSRIKTMEHISFRDNSDNSICFHLFHTNNIRNQHPYYQSNCDELHKIENMTKEQLTKYIATWRK
jgi:hypothetical protein